MKHANDWQDVLDWIADDLGRKEDDHADRQIPSAGAYAAAFAAMAHVAGLPPPAFADYSINGGIDFYWGLERTTAVAHFTDECLYQDMGRDIDGRCQVTGTMKAVSLADMVKLVHALARQQA